MSTFKPLIAVVGPSGSGKSTSLRNLDPQTTVILDGERKGFPFKGYNKFKILPFSNPVEFDRAFAEALKIPGVKLVVVESFTKYSEQVLQLCQRSYSGWDIWSNYAKFIRTRINSCKNTIVPVVFTCLDEIIKIPQPDGSEMARRAIAIQGQELKRSGIEPEFLIVLFTDVRNVNGKIEYRFETNNDGVTTAKTPMGMFEQRFIPNDLALVVREMEKYYEGQI